MNRTDRLLAIVLELQARKEVRAEDLAATFDVSKRTIYRDMLALAESSVPIVSIPGQGYSLVEGYFLPPLAFNTDEAIMLLLAAVLPPIPSGFWNRTPTAIPGRLRHLLAQADFPNLAAIDPQLRKKNSLTAHLPKGIDAHCRTKLAA
jgi:hypothetical protein